MKYFRAALVAIFLVPLSWQRIPALQAGEKCDPKKTECRDGSGRVTDCCHPSQKCKNGRCFYPGNLHSNPKEDTTIKNEGGSAAEKKMANVERINLLGKMLGESKDFKIRVQAAFSLAKIEDPKILPYLIKGLQDKHPAVRSAAATALGNAGDPGALGSLYQLLDKDPNPMVNDAIREAILKIETEPTELNEVNRVPEIICSVPYDKVKYLFVIGNMEDRADARRDDLTKIFKRHFSNQLKSIGNSMIVTGDSVPPSILDQVKRGKIHGFMFSASLKQLEGQWDETSEYSLSAKVSIICSRYPSQVMAMTMNSTATSSITRSGFRKKLIPKMQEEAISGAIEFLAQSVKDNLSRLTSEEGQGAKRFPAKRKKKKK